jgi:GntR family transcriptional regulator, transcriptional repressor for pyruvate dehydrogenase complex
MSSGRKRLAHARQPIDARSRRSSGAKLSIAERIVRDVLGRLTRKELAVGDFLGTEADLCDEFGVSRFPVREAFSRLGALGLVDIKRGVDGGVWIKTGDPDHFGELLAVHFLLADVSLVELFEARVAIVPKAAEHAAIRATPAQIGELRALLDRIEHERENFSEALDALLEFHMKLVEFSGLRTLSVLNRSLSFLLRDVHQRFPPPILTTSHAVETYSGLKSLRSVVKKIEARDSASAGEIMRTAIMGHRDAVLELAAKESADD